MVAVVAELRAALQVTPETPAHQTVAKAINMAEQEEAHRLDREVKLPHLIMLMVTLGKAQVRVDQVQVHGITTAH